MTHPADTTGLLYLGRQDLVALGGDRSQPYVDAITEGLALHAKDDFVQPLKPYLRWPGADHIADRIIAMPCYVGGEKPIAGLKWIGSRQHNPSRFQLERASAVIVLNDADTNYPVAIMEGGLISGMRTAAISAVATRHLAREGFTDVACIGCGPIARMQMQTLIEQFPASAASISSMCPGTRCARSAMRSRRVSRKWRAKRLTARSRPCARPT